MGPEERNVVPNDDGRFHLSDEWPMTSTGSALVVELAQLDYLLRAAERDRTDGGRYRDLEQVRRRRRQVVAALQTRGLELDAPRDRTLEEKPARRRTVRSDPDAVKVDQLERALASRTVIGQATGILMERHRVGPDAAFAVLVATSSHRNLKLRDVAQELVDDALTGDPDEAGPGCGDRPDTASRRAL